MKIWTSILFVAISMNLCAQKLEGVYKLTSTFGKQDTSIYLFRNQHYKHLYILTSWNGRDTHVRRVSEGIYKPYTDGFTIIDDGPLGGEYEYTIVQVTDSGILYDWVEDIKVFLGKTNMSVAGFDSLFGEFSKGARKATPVSSATTRYSYNNNTVKHLVLKNAETGKTRTLRQTGIMNFYRVYTDTLFHQVDTFLQVINGYIDSISDSLVYVRTGAFSADNHYTMNGWYDFDPERPDMHIEWYGAFSDSVFCFPKSQLTGIKRYKSASTIGNILIGTSLANALASPFYSINYKSFMVNKPLFKTSLLTSTGVLLTGIIIDIVAHPSYYSLCKRCKKHWVLAGLK